MNSLGISKKVGISMSEVPFFSSILLPVKASSERSDSFFFTFSRKYHKIYKIHCFFYLMTPNNDGIKSSTRVNTPLHVILSIGWR